MTLKPPTSPNTPAWQRGGWENVATTHGAVPGQNCTTAVLSALAALPTTGGTVFFPAAASKYLITADALDISDKRSIVFAGEGGVSAGALPASCLHVSNNGTYGLRVSSTYGFMWRDLALTYESGTFTGELVQVRQSAAALDPQMTCFENFSFGDGVATSASLLVNLLKAVNVSFSGEWTMHGAKRAVQGTTVGAAAGNYSNAVRFFGGRIKTSIASVLNPGIDWTFDGTSFQQLAGGVADAVTGLTPSANAAGGILTETGIPASDVTLIGCGFWDSQLASGGKWVDMSRVPVTNTLSATHSFTALGGSVGHADIGFDVTGGAPVMVAGQHWGTYNTQRVKYTGSSRNLVLAGDTAGDIVALDGTLQFKGVSTNFIAARAQNNINNTLLAFSLGGANDTFRLLAGGAMEFGDGTATRDVFLARSAANALNLTTADFLIGTAGRGLRVKEGSNAKMGTSTLVAGTVTVNTTAVTASSRIFLDGQNSSGTAGELTVSARTAGTSFTITSSSGTDTRSVAWMLVEPA